MSPVDPHFVSTSDFARRLWVDGTTSIYATLSEGLTKSRGVPPVANVYRLESGRLATETGPILAAVSGSPI